MGPFRAFLNATLIPRSLFWRSFLIVVVPILVLQIVLTVIFYNRHWDTVTKWLASGVAGEAALLADLVDATPPGTPRDDLLRRFALRTDLDVAFRPGTRLDPDGGGGRRLWHIDQKIVEAFREKLDRPFTIDLNADRPGLATVRVGTGGGVLELRTERRRLTSTTTGLLLAWMLGASAFLIAVAVYFLRIQVRPIRQLARSSADMRLNSSSPSDWLSSSRRNRGIASVAASASRSRCVVRSFIKQDEIAVNFSPERG